MGGPESRSLFSVDLVCEGRERGERAGDNERKEGDGGGGEREKKPGRGGRQRGAGGQGGAREEVRGMVVSTDAEGVLKFELDLARCAPRGNGVVGGGWGDPLGAGWAGEVSEFPTAVIRRIDVPVAAEAPDWRDVRGTRVT